MSEYITDNIEIYSDNSDGEVLMRKFPMKKILMKKILMKKIRYRMCLFLYLKHFE